MSTGVAPPMLPQYGTPLPRKCAILPESISVAELPKSPKPPGTLNKMISKMLPKKLGKMKAPKARIPHIKTKTRKKRKPVQFK